MTDPADIGARLAAIEGRLTMLERIVGRYLDHHCLTSDEDARCECQCCLDARQALDLTPRSRVNRP